MSFIVEKMSEEDWEQVRAIYLEGMATGNATFETSAPSWEHWDAAHLQCGRFVARNNVTQVIGWAALSPVSARRVYAGVAEVSIYVSEKSRGTGAGRALLKALVEESEKCGLWTLQAGIFPENLASIRLHQSCGFRLVGRRERIGCLRGRWRDVMLLERRSERVCHD